jgi:hypothetical protein
LPPILLTVGVELNGDIGASPQSICQTRLKGSAVSKVDCMPNVNDGRFTGGLRIVFRSGRFEDSVGGALSLVRLL